MHWHLWHHKTAAIIGFVTYHFVQYSDGSIALVKIESELGVIHLDGWQFPGIVCKLKVKYKEKINLVNS